MKTNEEMKKFLSNPANRLLIDLNTIKKQFKPVIKQMDKVKNINSEKTVDILLNNMIKDNIHMINTKSKDEVTVLSITANMISDYITSIYKWKKWKKIYTFDSTLSLTLNEQADKTDPDKINIPIEFLQNIPYETFYIATDNLFDGLEYSNDKLIDNIVGFFVKLDPDHKGRTNLSFTVPLGECYLIEGSKDLNNINSYESSNFASHNYEITLTSNTIGECIQTAIDARAMKDPLIKDIYKKVSMRCLTYLLYILSVNSDIIDGSIDTYRPKKKKESILDTLSEVQQFNVGYRVSSILKQHRLYTIYDSTRIDGKKKIPHTRRGHWHHYWTGPRNSDNRELIVHWISPIIVNSNWRENPVVEETPVQL